MVWDTGTIRQLRDFWTEGHSTAEIGRRLGVSKNAIVGKAHRLELEARPSPIRRGVVKPVVDRVSVFPRCAGPTLPPLASARLSAPSVPPSNVQVLRSPAVTAPAAPQALAVQRFRPAPAQHMRRAAPSCCWPIGDPGTKAFHFCDDASLPGKPYCDEHAKLAYVKIRDRKDDAA